MSTIGRTSQAGLDDALEQQAELDRKSLHLRTLCEVSRELAGLVHPKKIMETFLLSVMGPMGIVQGLGVIFNAQSHEATVSHRGLSSGAVEAFGDSLPRIHQRCLMEEGEAPPYVPYLHLRSGSFAEESDLLPPGVATLIHWRMAGDFHGFLGLGETLSGRPFSGEDLDILLSFTQVLVGALSQSLHAVSIQQLNASLQRKNLDLQASLDEEKKTRTELDRRVFFLRTLSDLNAELGSLVRTEKLLEAFLLVTMGALGVGSGFVLLYDRETDTVRSVGRGLESLAQPEGAAVSALLYKCFEVSEERRLTPMSHTPLTTPKVLEEAGWGIEVENAFLFMVDHSLLGVAGFGPTIRSAVLDSEEYALLRQMLTSFLVHLKNAESFERIQQLNEDLVQRNEDLTQTIVELREARRTIALQERAKAHLKAMVEREMERVGKVRPLDFVFILVLSACVGVLFNLTNPNAIPLFPASLLQPAPKEVDVEAARTLLHAGAAVVVDARPREMFDRKHIRGAISVPLVLFDILYVMKLSSIEPDKSIIVYGRTISRHYDREMVLLLNRRDHDRVAVLAGGLEAWEERGYEVEP